MEEADKVAHVVAVGMNVDLVDIEARKGFLDLQVVRARGDVEFFAGDGAGGIDEGLFAGFGIGQLDEPRVWQGQFARVGDGDGDEVVVDGGKLEGFVVFRILEVGDEEGDALLFDHFPEVVERAGNAGAFAFWLKAEDFADNVQDVELAFAGRNEELDLVGEDDKSDLVVVLDGGEGEEAAELGGSFVLRFFDGAKGAGGG